MKKSIDKKISRSVIPVQAGIQRFFYRPGVDPRLRGDDIPFFHRLLEGRTDFSGLAYISGFGFRPKKCVIPPARERLQRKVAAVVDQMSAIRSQRT